uniref:Uncharacterized protein n=1 Tax=Siphoviridae sp. ctZHD14 TaxID=2827891 RepID=A0A8S5SWC0_9CAUD|nr:MAG TPA: hypothetical protein [Siphoviridae sp. ctZHD14]
MLQIRRKRWTKTKICGDKKSFFSYIISSQ